MTDKKVWLITGAGRGLGLDIAKAALAAGHAVVATGRDLAKVTAAVGHHDDLLAIKLDVTRPEDAQPRSLPPSPSLAGSTSWSTTPATSIAGFFEELSPDQIRNQIETLLFGPMNVTRAVLPVMRKQRSGCCSLSPRPRASPAKCSARRMPQRSSASKDGSSRSPRRSLPSASARCWSSRVSSAPSCSPLSPPLTPSPPSTITPSALRETVTAWSGMNGKQGGDPAKLAEAIVQLAELRNLRSFAAGADAVQTFEGKAKTLLAQATPTAICPPPSPTGKSSVEDAAHLIGCPRRLVVDHRRVWVTKPQSASNSYSTVADRANVDIPEESNTHCPIAVTHRATSNAV